MEVQHQLHGVSQRLYVLPMSSIPRTADDFRSERTPRPTLPRISTSDTAMSSMFRNHEAKLRRRFSDKEFLIHGNAILSQNATSQKPRKVKPVEIESTWSQQVKFINERRSRFVEKKQPDVADEYGNASRQINIILNGKLYDGAGDVLRTRKLQQISPGKSKRLFSITRSNGKKTGEMQVAGVSCKLPEHRVEHTFVTSEESFKALKSYIPTLEDIVNKELDDMRLETRVTGNSSLVRQMKTQALKFRRFLESVITSSERLGEVAFRECWFAEHVSAKTRRKILSDTWSTLTSNDFRIAEDFFRMFVPDLAELSTKAEDDDEESGELLVKMFETLTGRPLQALEDDDAIVSQHPETANRYERLKELDSELAQTCLLCRAMIVPHFFLILLSSHGKQISVSVNCPQSEHQKLWVKTCLLIKVQQVLESLLNCLPRRIVNSSCPVVPCGIPRTAIG